MKLGRIPLQKKWGAGGGQGAQASLRSSVSVYSSMGTNQLSVSGDANELGKEFCKRVPLLLPGLSVARPCFKRQPFPHWTSWFRSTSWSWTLEKAESKLQDVERKPKVETFLSRQKPSIIPLSARLDSQHSHSDIMPSRYKMDSLAAIQSALILQGPANLCAKEELC